MKNIKMVLFDLDGTLLPMDQNVFVKTYFSGLAKHLATIGYEQKSLIDAIWAGTAAMIKNDGKMTNEEAFWKTFSGIFGKDARKDEPHFERFYEEEFDKVQPACGYTPMARKVIDLIKERGVRTALATNPIFPAIATRKRIAWAGLTPEDFELYTSYENSTSCKPNLDYYREVIDKLGVEAGECLMVGNDVHEDMIAEELGMSVFLLTDCIINRKNTDTTKYRQGDFAALTEYLDEILK